MQAVTPVKLTLPDGVERELRFTLGAQKLIVDLTGMLLRDALNKYDSGAFPEILYALMHDEEGEPPAVSLKWLRNNLPLTAAPEIMAAILSAMVQGQAPKNEIEALVKKEMESQNQNQNGSLSSASPPSASGSVVEISGGAILSAN